MKNILYYKERKHLADKMKLLYDRKLTNAAGGNAAVRVDDDKMIVTPTMMSENMDCSLTAEDIIVCD